MTNDVTGRLSIWVPRIYLTSTGISAVKGDKPGLEDISDELSTTGTELHGKGIRFLLVRVGETQHSFRILSTQEEADGQPQYHIHQTAFSSELGSHITVDVDKSNNNIQFELHDPAKRPSKQRPADMRKNSVDGSGKPRTSQAATRTAQQHNLDEHTILGVKQILLYDLASSLMKEMQVKVQQGPVTVAVLQVTVVLMPALHEGWLSKCPRWRGSASPIQSWHRRWARLLLDGRLQLFSAPVGQAGTLGSQVLVDKLGPLDATSPSPQTSSAKGHSPAAVAATHQRPAAQDAGSPPSGGAAAACKKGTQSGGEAAGSGSKTARAACCFKASGMDQHSGTRKKWVLQAESAAEAGQWLEALATRWEVAEQRLLEMGSQTAALYRRHTRMCLRAPVVKAMQQGYGQPQKSGEEAVAGNSTATEDTIGTCVYADHGTSTAGEWGVAATIAADGSCVVGLDAESVEVLVVGTPGSSRGRRGSSLEVDVAAAQEEDGGRGHSGCGKDGEATAVWPLTPKTPADLKVLPVWLAIDADEFV